MSTVLAAPPERVMAEIETIRLLRHVAAPVLAFAPVEPPEFPERWADGRYLVAMRLFGLVPLGRQWIVTSRSRPSDDEWRLRDAGTGQIAKTWDHHITLVRRGDGHTDYSDEVEVKAGVLTPLVWLFGQFFYRHRQRRWRRLVAEGFRY